MADAGITIASVHAAWLTGGTEAASLMGVHLPDRQKLNQLVMQAMGGASMCWERVDKAGIFNAEGAKAIGEALIYELLTEMIAAQLDR